MELKYFGAFGFKDFLFRLSQCFRLGFNLLDYDGMCFLLFCYLFCCYFCVIYFAEFLQIFVALETGYRFVLKIISIICLKIKYLNAYWCLLVAFVRSARNRVYVNTTRIFLSFDVVAYVFHSSISYFHFISLIDTNILNTNKA